MSVYVCVSVCAFRADGAQFVNDASNGARWKIGIHNFLLKLLFSTRYFHVPSYAAHKIKFQVPARLKMKMMMMVMKMKRFIFRYFLHHLP